jgi:hypothetical protein
MRARFILEHSALRKVSYINAQGFREANIRISGIVQQIGETAVAMTTLVRTILFLIVR